MSDIGPNDIEIRVHGLTEEDHGQVEARLFANKLKNLVGALEASDALVNGKRSHRYLLQSMHMSRPTALLRETCYSDEAAASSAIPALHNSIEAIKTRDEVGINKYASIVRKIGLLASGAEKTFGFAEIETSNKHVVRVDNFLKERVSTASDHIKGKWFAGAVYGSFDGTLRFVDTRGQLPQIKLILSAGGKELDCTCSREDIETLGNILDQRVMIYGRAIYVGSSPIPARVEVSSFQPIKKDADFSKWQGSFHPFEEIWDGE